MLFLRTFLKSILIIGIATWLTACGGGGGGGGGGIVGNTLNAVGFAAGDSGSTGRVVSGVIPGCTKLVNGLNHCGNSFDSKNNCRLSKTLMFLCDKYSTTTGTTVSFPLPGRPVSSIKCKGCGSFFLNNLLKYFVIRGN